MSNKKRKKYRKKKDKNSSLFSNPIFRKFLYFAVIVIVAFFIWQLFFYTSPEERVLNISEDKEEIENFYLAGSSVESALNYALKRLEIPRKFISTREEDEETYISVIVDKNQLSLTICNIFITDTIEEAGGQVLKSDESTNQTSLQMKIFDPENKHYFILNLHTDEEGNYKKITRLSIIVDDCGFVDGDLLEDFLALDKAITYSILPGLRYSQTVMQKAHNKNIETMIHIPMEPVSYPQNDPGENAIFVDYSTDKIKKLMNSYIKELPLCVGANNHMGSLATKYENIMTPVLEVLKQKGLFFVDSRTTQNSVSAVIANEIGINVGENDLFLDNTNSKNRVKRMTEKILAYAKNHDNIIAITHFKESSLQELKKILNNLEGENIKLVPVSEIVNPKDYIL